MNRRLLRGLGLLLLAATVVLGIGRLRFDVEVLNLLPANSASVQGLRLYQENFANARELILTVQAGDAAAAENAARQVAATLRATPALVTAAHWQPPWLEHPGEAAELLAFLWLNQSPARFAELRRRLDDVGLQQALAETRDELTTSLSPETIARRSYDPFRLGVLPGDGGLGIPAWDSGGEFFASADGTFRVVFVESAVDLAGYKACVAWLGQIRARLDQARAGAGFPEGVALGFTGRPAFVAEIGGGMESDFAGPSAITLVVIALLFYAVHRRWLPLGWLVLLLGLILAGTLAVGGLVLGTLNVVSLGFASILLGLAEDFGIVLYQESRSHPELSTDEVRRAAAPGIVWSAVTTAGAFLLLNLSSLPGLRQMGTLVAIGVLVAAGVMLYAYLPPLARFSRSHGANPAAQPNANVPSPVRNPGRRGLLLAPALGIGALLLCLWRPPVFDASTETLRPRNSTAYATLAEMKRQLGRSQDPWWLMIPGRDEQDVVLQLTAIQPILRDAVVNGLLREFTLPTPLWPDPDAQAANRLELPGVLERRDALRAAAAAAGFNREALALTERLFAAWDQARAGTGVFWPTNAASRWILDQFSAQPGRRPGLALPIAWAPGTRPELLALGLLYPGSNAPAATPALLQQRLASDSILLTGWPVLGQEVFHLVQRDLLRVLPPMAVLLVVTLWLAFRRGRDVFLSLASLAVSGLFLQAVMTLAGWSWNLMNLMALPLLLGVGVDFSIHMQLALHRHHGDTAAVQRSVGRALLLAGSTTIAGFASLAFASNAGIASLGQVCAAGIACCLLTAVGFLPGWWHAFTRRPG